MKSIADARAAAPRGASAALAATLALASALGLAACTSTGRSVVRNYDVLTREEIVAANQMTALQLVQTLRPQWLHRRGNRTMSGETDIVVYYDGTRFGGPESLADIPAIHIARMEFYDAARAQYRFGVGHLHGAIEVLTRR